MSQQSTIAAGDMRVDQVRFPQESILSQNKADYTDSFSLILHDPTDAIRPVEVGRAFFYTAPDWIESLMHFRNRVVSVFGLKTGEKKSKEEVVRAFTGKEGETIGFFKVFKLLPEELVMGEDDRHLNFRVSCLLRMIEGGKKELVLSTTVHYNHWFGRFYFFFVKPFHRLIVPAMMKAIGRYFLDIEKSES